MTKNETELLEALQNAMPYLYHWAGRSSTLKQAEKVIKNVTKMNETIQNNENKRNCRLCK